MVAAVRVIFRGRVQGVFFRANTKAKARELGVRGWVRNLPDGTVEAFFEGSEGAVREIIEWCRYHQPYAQVTGVDVEWCGGEGHEGFEIRY